MRARTVSLNILTRPGFRHLVMCLVVSSGQPQHWQRLVCVGWRSDNDSFAKQLGMLGRFALDIKGYKTIIYGLCKSDPKLRSFLINKICSIHFFAHVKKIKLFSSGALSLCLEHLKEIPSFWYKLLPLLMMPRKILVWIRFFYLKWHRVRSL